MFKTLWVKNSKHCTRVSVTSIRGCVLPKTDTWCGDAMWLSEGTSFAVTQRRVFWSTRYAGPSLDRYDGNVSPMLGIIQDLRWNHSHLCPSSPPILVHEHDILLFCQFISDGCSQSWNQGKVNNKYVWIASKTTTKGTKYLHKYLLFWREINESVRPLATLSDVHGPASGRYRTNDYSVSNKKDYICVVAPIERMTTT